MRNLNINNLKLKNIDNEELFYQSYLKNLPNNITDTDNTFHSPKKQYEIFFLNILGGKLMLLNKDYINFEDTTRQELFFDYNTALKIYNLMLDIIESVKDEQNEISELYMDERLQKHSEIDSLIKQDEILFKQKQQEYDTIINSEIYKEYTKLKLENENLKSENLKLKEQINTIEIQQSNNIGFFKKLLNKFKNKQLPMG